MNPDEIARELRESLPPKIDYAELVGAEGFAHGACYVWDDPLPYLMSNAADLIESLQAQLAAERIKYAELQRYNVDCTKACDRQMVEILELREQSAQLSNARNELCQRCGRYREAHKGACDGCRWKEKTKC